MSANGGSQASSPSSSWTDRIYLHIYDYETKEFSGLTTYHGLVRIYNSNTWPSRIFWCVVVLSCLSLFMIHSGFLLLGYHSKPTLFQVNTVVSKDGLQFPDITVCSNNPLDPRKVEAWNISLNLASYLTNAYAQYIPGNQSLSIYQEYLELVQRYEKEKEKSFVLEDFLKAIAPSCSDVLVSCAFAGRQVPNCCDLAKPVFTDVGPCFRITGEEAGKRQWFSGSGYGWQIVVDGQNHWKSFELADQFQDDGVRVLLHAGGATMQSRSVAAPPGTSIFVTVDAKNISLLPRTDWGVCQKDWDPEVTGEPLLPLQYSSIHCEWNSEARKWLTGCGCVPLPLHYNDSHPVCDPFQIVNCQDYLLNSLTHVCDSECNFMQYDTSHSYADLTSRGFYSGRNYTEEYIRDSVTVIWLYFRTITVERQEQQKQLQTADLLSNIAGSMGLFLGMSTVTLLEIFIYLFKSVWGTVNTERQKQFLQAMLEEEEERRQSLVIVEGPVEQTVEEEEVPGAEVVQQPRKASILPPLHIHLGRGRSDRRDSGVLGIRRDSSAFALRRDSTALDAIHTPRRSVSVAPLLHPRQSIALGALYRRGSHLDPGEQAPSRRGSGVPAASFTRLAVPSAGPRRLSASPLDETLHLSYNPSRRKSSVHLRNLLL